MNPLRLLRIEFKKLKAYRAFWLALISYGLLMPALFISIHNFKINVGGSELTISFYNFPDVWHNVSYIASWFNILLYFFVILLVGNEYQYKTFRQNIIDGMSRWQALMAKIYLMLLFALGSTLLVTLVGWGCGVWLGDVATYPFSFEKVHFVGYYGLQVLCYMSFALMLTHLLRKQGMSIVVFLLYAFVAEPVLQYKVFKDWIPLPTVAESLPLDTFGALITNPFPAYFGIGEVTAVEPKTLGLSVIYLLVFLSAGGLLTQKRDV